MNVDIIFQPIPLNHISTKTVVVIDVLRASSTIVAAFANGCQSITPVADVDTAYGLKSKNPDLLLCGEREGRKLKNFDLGNSPLEYQKAKINNRELILTTSNGTQAVNFAQSASHLIIGSFLNINAVVEKIIAWEDDTIFLCSGNDGYFSLDDALCAGVLLQRLKQKVNNLIFEDGCMWTEHAIKNIIADYQSLTNKQIFQIMSQTIHGKKLKTIGFVSDVEYCSQQNLYAITPFFIEGKFII